MTIFKSIRYTCASIILVTSISTSAWCQSELETMRQVLVAREEAIRSYHIELNSVSRNNITNCKIGAKYCNDYINIIKRKYPSSAPLIDTLSKRQKSLNSEISTSGFFGIDYADHNVWKILNYGANSAYDTAKINTTSIMKNGEWHHYTPPQYVAGAKARVPESGVLLVNKESVGLLSPSILLGFGVPINTLFTVSDSSKLKQYYSWNDLFDVNKKGTIVVGNQQIIKDKQGEKKCKVIHITTETSVNSPIGFYKYDLFLDTDRLLCPVKVIAYVAVTGIKNADPYHNIEYVIHWSNAQSDPSGIYLPMSIQVDTYQPFAKVDEIKPMDEWKLDSLNINSTVYTVTKFEFKDDIVATNIEVDAPPGTHVANHNTGYTYVTGSAGEAIDKAAIAVRNRFGIKDDKPAGLTLSRIVYSLLAIGLVALFLVLYRIYVVRKRTTT